MIRRIVGALLGVAACTWLVFVVVVPLPVDEIEGLPSRRPARLRRSAPSRPDALVNAALYRNESHLQHVLALERKGVVAVPRGDVLSVDHGAWIVDKSVIPRMHRGETIEELNDKLIDAIINELSSAWPPRVVSWFARALAVRAFNMEVGGGEPKTTEKKVAFLFLVGGSIATEPLWRAFFASRLARARATIVVHPPPGFQFPASSFFAPFVLPERERVRVTWGSLGLVHAELRLLAAALKDELNVRFVLLSETDVPLWPFKCTYTALVSRPDLSFVDSRKTLERFEMFDFYDSDSWRKGSQWFALSREHARALVDRRELQSWYDAHAHKQLRRAKLQRMGPVAKMAHVASKPNFADEHYVQTTLARKGLEDQLVAASRTFAPFGREGEYTVWGDGQKHDFQLHDAKWHAVQFGAVSVAALESFHELCDFDLDNRGPQRERNVTARERRAPWRNATSARVFRGPFEPKRLSCSLDTPKGTSSPCFLFARKIHPEAASYYGEQLATYFIEKTMPGLADPLNRLRRVQRAASRTEVAAILADRALPKGEDYATVHMKALLTLLPPEFVADTQAAALVDEPWPTTNLLNPPPAGADDDRDERRAADLDATRRAGLVQTYTRRDDDEREPR